jgi:transcriptional regulator with XRE-family HTH domain
LEFGHAAHQEELQVKIPTLPKPMLFRQRLKGMLANEITIAQLARVLGVSHSAVYRYAAGTLNADEARIPEFERKLAAWIKRLSARVSS